MVQSYKKNQINKENNDFFMYSLIKNWCLLIKFAFFVWGNVPLQKKNQTTILVIMKKGVFLLAMVLAVSAAKADNYDYFVFKQSDGTETSLTSSDLRITFADGKLVATSSSGSFSVALSSLGSMYFSNNSTSIASLSVDTNEEATIYDLKGVLVAKGQNNKELTSSLAPGIYIKKVGETTSKILVK